MNPEEIKKLADDICHRGESWLKNAKQVADAIPFVQKTVEFGGQFSQMFASTPPSASTLAWEPVAQALVQTEAVLGSDALQLGNSTLGAAVSGAAIISSAGTHATGLFTGATGSGDAQLQSWARQGLAAFEKLHSAEDNKAFIRKKLATLYAGSEAEFDGSLSEYAKAIAGAVAPSSAGIAMRNVLETLNGNMLQLARAAAAGKKVQVKSWTDAAVIVAKGAPTSPETNQLLAQKAVYDDLHDMKLTKIAKNDWQPNQSDWEALLAQFLGFLFGVLGLIDLKDGS